MSEWLSDLPANWHIADPRRHFRDRREVARSDDAHLTPSQHMGVLTQADYMERTGSRVVLNLSAPDNMKHVEPGDFIAHLRSFQGGLERSSLRGKVSTAYTVIVPGDSVHGPFYRWVLKSSAFISALSASLEQLRDGQSVKFDDFAAIPLPLPPVGEQRRIADFLDDRISRIDQIIAVRQQQHDLIRTCFASEASGLLDGIGTSGPPLSAVADIVDTEHKTAPTVPGGGHWVAGTSAIRNGRLVAQRLRETDEESFRAWTSRGVPRSGDVLLTREAPVGEVALLTSEDPNVAIGQRVVLLKPHRHTLSSAFLRLVLMAGQLREVIDLASSGSLHPHLNMADISRLRIPRLSKDDQVRIGTQHDSLLGELARRSRQVDRSTTLLQEYKQSLITAAVTGKLDVTTAGSGIPG